MEKWQALVSSNIHATINPNQVWSLLGDYCNFHNFLPYLAVCRNVEGSNGVLGCVRYCTSAPDSTGRFYWANEKLVAIDISRRSYSYEILENNMGFGKYLATLRVLEDVDGCKIVWEFECEPIVGRTKDDFVSFMGDAVKDIAKRVEEVAAAANGN